MDVFSCKPFDYGAALERIERHLGVTRRAADVIRRPVVGEQVREAVEPHWRLQPLPPMSPPRHDRHRAPDRDRELVGVG
jgi:hypothetical protein